MLVCYSVFYLFLCPYYLKNLFFLSKMLFCYYVLNPFLCLKQDGMSSGQSLATKS